MGSKILKKMSRDTLENIFSLPCVFWWHFSVSTPPSPQECHVLFEWHLNVISSRDVMEYKSKQKKRIKKKNTNKSLNFPFEKYVTLDEGKVSPNITGLNTM